MGLAAGGLTAFGTIAAIGAVVGGVGAVTGNKSLTKIGGLMGAVGGIGSLAQSSGLLAGADAATSVMDPIAEASNGLAEAATGAGSFDMPSTQGLLNSKDNDMLASANTGTMTDVPQGIRGEVELAPSSTQVRPQNAPPDVSRLGPDNTVEELAPLGDKPAQPGTIGSSGAFDSITKLLGPISKFMGENKMLTYGAMQLIGGGLSYMDPIRGAQEELLRTQIKQNELRIASMSGPQPQVGILASARPSVHRTGASTYQQPNVNTGLINGVRA